MLDNPYQSPEAEPEKPVAAPGDYAQTDPKLALFILISGFAWVAFILYSLR